jgi:hypothetical protein
MSLMNRPDLLILDEPTTGLDPAVRHALWSRVRELRAGNRVMIYADDATPVIEWIHAHDGGEWRPLVVRPTNLEDVFLSVTGTSLEEHP